MIGLWQSVRSAPFVLIGPVVSYLRSQRAFTVMVFGYLNRIRAEMGSIGSPWFWRPPCPGHCSPGPCWIAPQERRGAAAGGAFVPHPPSPSSLWAVLLDFHSL
jgi:hypothetical protein